MTRRRAEPRCLAFALAAWALVAQAQQGGGGAPAGGLLIKPRVGLTQTWTDNLRLDSQDKDAALITTVSPGITVVSNSGMLRGSLDYSLNGSVYLKTDQPSRVRNALSANGQAELISRMLYVDMRATIGQQNASAFGSLSAPTLGAQGGLSNLANANERETGSLSVAPSLRGMLGNLASYELRGEFARTEVRGASLGDSRSSGGGLSINEANPGVLSWWMRANTQRVKAEAAASNETLSMRLGLSYRPDPDWVFTLNAGRERNDYLAAGTRDAATYGATADWTPTPRTRIGADWQRQQYGNSHGLNFEHRMARTVLRLADTQTTTLGNTGASGGQRTYYDLFYLLFTSQEPDPTKRDLLVRNYLQSQGLSPDAPLANGFLSSGPSRLRSQQLGLTLQGQRGSVSLLANRALTRRLAEGLNQGDLASNARVEQRSISLSASYQLTPVSGLSLAATRQESTGDRGTGAASELTTLTASWNARLGRQLSVQLGGRHSRADGLATYTENAVYASLTQQF